MTIILNETKRNLRLCAACACAFLIGVRIYQGHKTGINKAQMQAQTVRLAHLKAQRKKLTKSHLKLVYDTDEPNLGDVLSANQSRIRRGMEIAFSKCQKPDDFTLHKHSIVHQLGSSVSSKVLPLIRPTEDGIADNRSVSNKLTFYDVSYGRFDSDSGTIPMIINLSFTTPKISSVTVNDNNDKPKVRNGQMVITAQLNVHSHTMTVTHEHNAIDGHQMSDNSNND